MPEDLNTSLLLSDDCACASLLTSESSACSTVELFVLTCGVFVLILVEILGLIYLNLH